MPNVTEKDKQAWIGDRQVPGHGTPTAEVTSVVDTSVDEDDSAEESDDSSDDESYE